MGRASEDLRMGAILTRLARRGVDIADTRSVILALEDELGGCYKIIRDLRKHRKADLAAAKRNADDAHRVGFRDGVEKMAACAICVAKDLIEDPDIAAHMALFLIREQNGFFSCQGGADG